MRGNQPRAGLRLHLLLIVLLLSSALAVATQSGGAAHAAPVNYPALQPVSCSQESSLRSIDGSTSTNIEFVNNSPISVRVYWLDYASGARVLYQTLAPGQSYLQQTYVTHPWVITDLGDVCINIFMPTASTSSAVITIPTVPQQLCSLEGALQSGVGPQSGLLFVNDTAQTVHLWWLDGNGQRQDRGLIQPGQSAGQLTSQSHAFLLSDLAGTCIGIFTATDRPSVGYLTTSSGGAISGTIYADAAAPGNEVAIDPMNVCGPSGCISLTTDSQGSYTLTGLPDGQYSVNAVPSFVNQVTGATLIPAPISGGNQLTGQNIVVNRLRSISGAVYGGDTSNPLSGAFVQACRTLTAICATTLTDPSGGYSIKPLAPGNFTITVFPPGGTPYAVGTMHVTLSSQDLIAPNMVLQVPQPMPSSVTITNHGISPGGIPTVNWGDTLTLTASGCSGGTGTFTITDAGSTTIATGAMSEGPSGTYTGTVFPLFPNHGNAHVTISLSCSATPIAFDMYIDPSGTVKDQNGNPVAGATVTLFQASSPSGPFTQVPNGSAIMSPGNRNNPDATDARGHFGWDVVAGFYRVRAGAPGCHAPGNPSQSFVESRVLAIPPPVTNLVLALECDTTPPVITPTVTGTAGNNGWYTSDVAVSWDVSDPESAVSSKTGCDTTAISADTGGTAVTCAATSGGGTASRSLTIKRDATLPTASFSSHPASYTVDQAVDIACTDSDNLSGVDPASTCPSLSAAPAYGFPLGLNALNAAVKDKAGNTKSAATSFTVVVTYGSLCTVTQRFVESSPKYQALSPTARATIDAQVSALCQYLSNAKIAPTQAQKAALVLAYQKMVAALVPAGWLSQSQADTLTRLSKGL